MFIAGLQKTPLAALSRGVAGVVKHSLVITLPGSVKGATENLMAVLPVLSHAIDLIQNNLEKTEAMHKEIIQKDGENSLLNSNQHDGCCHYTHGIGDRPRESTFPMIEYTRGTHFF